MGGAIVKVVVLNVSCRATRYSNLSGVLKSLLHLPPGIGWNKSPLSFHWFRFLMWLHYYNDFLFSTSDTLPFLLKMYRLDDKHISCHILGNMMT